MRRPLGITVTALVAAAAWSASWRAPDGLAPTAAVAGSGATSAAQGNPRLSFEDVASFAKAMERDLAAKGARLAIVFRTGETRDKLPPGMAYTHGAFWVHTPIVTTQGERIQGYAVFNLFHGDDKTLPSNRSYLMQDWPADFVAGTAVDDLGVIIPSPEMQRRILAVMESPAYAQLHILPYSLVSHPHDGRFQNCTEFMLDVIASALWQTTDYRQIKANLRANFKPQEVKLGAMERMFGPMVERRISFDDQPRGRVETTAYESMAAFLQANGLLQETYVFHRPSAAP